MKCYVCHIGLVKGNYHKHHVIPQHLGGKQKPTVVICPSCHTNVHAFTRKWKRSTAEAQDLIDVTYKNRGAKERLIELARYELQSELNPLGRGDYKVVLEFTPTEYQLIKDAAKRSKLSIANFCKASVKASSVPLINRRDFKLDWQK